MDNLSIFRDPELANRRKSFPGHGLDCLARHVVHFVAVEGIVPVRALDLVFGTPVLTRVVGRETAAVVLAVSIFELSATLVERCSGLHAGEYGESEYMGGGTWSPNKPSGVQRTAIPKLEIELNERATILGHREEGWNTSDLSFKRPPSRYRLIDATGSASALWTWSAIYCL